MASASDHIALANRCDTTLQYLLLAHQDHPEWIAIAAFYKAVNVVESLFSHCDRFHSHGHAARLDQLGRKYPTIFKHFRVLYAQSMIARYLSDKGGGGSYKCFTDQMPADLVVMELVGRRLITVENMCVEAMADPAVTGKLAKTNHAALPVKK